MCSLSLRARAAGMRLRFTKGINKAVILSLVDEMLENKEVVSGAGRGQAAGLRKHLPSSPPEMLASAAGGLGCVQSAQEEH